MRSNSCANGIWTSRFALIFLAWCLSSCGVEFVSEASKAQPLGEGIIKLDKVEKTILEESVGQSSVYVYLMKRSDSPDGDIGIDVLLQEVKNSNEINLMTENVNFYTKCISSDVIRAYRSTVENNNGNHMEIYYLQRATDSVFKISVFPAR